MFKLTLNISVPLDWKQKYDKCIANAVTKGGVGFFVGLGLSIVLFRREFGQYFGCLSCRFSTGRSPFLPCLFFPNLDFASLSLRKTIPRPARHGLRSRDGLLGMQL